MIWKGCSVGHIGFDSVRKEIQWTERHIKLLETAGEVIGTALQERKLSFSGLLSSGNEPCDLGLDEFIAQFSAWLHCHDVLRLHTEAAIPKTTPSARYPIIAGLATGKVANKVLQSEAAEFVLKVDGMEQHGHRIRKLYENTAIKSRYLANPDFSLSNENDFIFFTRGWQSLLPFFSNCDSDTEISHVGSEQEAKSFKLQPPSIQFRMQKFKEVAVPVIVDISRKAIEGTMQQFGEILAL